ncbi:MAG: hypothetical protein ACLR1T_09085 [Evtepia gabavorous]
MRGNFPDLCRTKPGGKDVPGIAAARAACPGGIPLLLWCLANAIEIQNNYGDIKLSKKHKDDTERIDPVAAAMNALARALVQRDKHDLSAALASGTFTL